MQIFHGVSRGAGVKESLGRRFLDIEECWGSESLWVKTRVVSGDVRGRFLIFWPVSGGKNGLICINLPRFDPQGGRKTGGSGVASEHLWMLSWSLSGF